MINQFRIQCSEVTYFTVLVEAETMQEAEDLLHADVNAFEVEDEYSGEWVIEDITLKLFLTSTIQWVTHLALVVVNVFRHVLREH